MNGQQKIQINFSSDIKILMIEKMRKGGFLFNTKLDVETLVRQYFNLIIRQIEAQPRKVHISRELLSNPPTGELKKGLDTIIGFIVKGRNLNHFLSSEILNPGYHDPLLYDWGIHHLHLGYEFNKKDSRFINRTKELLFAWVDSDNIYLIDILDHDPIDSFANKKLIEIIHQNWPFLISNSRLNDVKPVVDLTNKDIHKVRKAGALTIISTNDGSCYMSTGGGYATNGSSLMATRQTDQLLAQIFSIEEGVKANDHVIRKAIADAGMKCPVTLKLRLSSWDEQGVIVNETKTKLRLRLLW